tara:strand:- start:2491 stop:2631 length:141 start_codon:yes stop_codon:yes gene_type:complete
MVRKLIKKIFGIKGVEDIQSECFVKPKYAYSLSKAKKKTEDAKPKT